eukprot:scaffold2972_cov257-Chaetoceros_neogracile.AAC.13
MMIISQSNKSLGCRCGINFLPAAADDILRRRASDRFKSSVDKVFQTQLQQALIRTHFHSREQGTPPT